MNRREIEDIFARAFEAAPDERRKMLDELAMTPTRPEEVAWGMLLGIVGPVTMISLMTPVGGLKICLSTSLVLLPCMSGRPNPIEVSPRAEKELCTA